MHQSNPHSPVTLVSVGEPQATDDGRFYFVARFKRGAFGKAVTRTFWSKESDGKPQWERVSPEDLTPLVGQDLSAEVAIEAVDIEPEEFVSPTTGEVHEITSRTVVRFSDETLEQAVRRSGSVLRSPVGDAGDGGTATHPATSPVPSGAFHVVGLNGQGVSPSGL